MTKLKGCIAACVVFLLFAAMANAAPTINLSKRIGPPTTEIDVWGHGFHPHSVVDIYFDTRDEAIVLTNNEGEFQDAVIHAPRQARPGEHRVMALERNRNIGDQKTFVVNTNWKQLNFGPGHEGVNPYENVIDQSNVGNLVLAWNYRTTTGGSTVGPAVADGVVYASSYAGDLYAVDAETGELLWKNPSSTGGITYPTVGDGLVYVGEDSDVNALTEETGHLVWKFRPNTNSCCFSAPTVSDDRAYATLDQVYALDSRTGALLWKYPLDGSGQAFANGVIYVGRSESYNNVVALEAKTGTLLWTATVQGGVYASPTISKGVLFVPTSSGMIFALNAQTGQLRWKYTTDSTAGSPSPVVAGGGMVFFSSSDNVAYALDAGSGTLLWSYSEKSALNNAGAAFANDVVYFGLGNDILAFEPKSGSVLWQYTIAGNVICPPAVANGVVYASVPDNDGSLYAFHLGESATSGKMAAP